MSGNDTARDRGREIRRTTLRCLLLAVLLAVGSPALLAFTRPGMRFYLLQPMIFLVQAVPYVFAAALWLPWRAADTGRIGRTLAYLLLAGAVVVYVPQLTGLWPVGGDMVALGYMAIAIGTVLFVLVATAIAFGIHWLHGKRRRSS